MGNLEKPLTWGLTILLLGYLFVANCKCGEESTCELNNGFITASTGNHGKAVAYVSKMLNLKGTVYVPKKVSKTKLEANINNMKDNNTFFLFKISIK